MVVPYTARDLRKSKAISMNDSPDKVSDDRPEELTAQERHAARRRVVWFVVVFVVCVVTLLATYRYLTPTVGNDYYLYTVGLNTVWLLELVGHSADLGDIDMITDPPELVRARIEAWKKGAEAPDAVQRPAEMPPPLTRWEARRYRAEMARRGLASEGDEGPMVSFVLKPGLTTDIREVTRQIRRVKADPWLDEAARAEKVSALDATLVGLQKRLDEAREKKEPPSVTRGYSFPFTVVPDCGAIPSMSIFFAAVVAFPSRWWKRLLGIAVGVPVLYAVNCFRLACLAVIGAWDYGNGYGGRYFNFAHHYVWQGIYIVFVVAVWMLWVEFVVRGREKWENQPASEQ